jgi:hypothetical protein
MIVNAERTRRAAAALLSFVTREEKAPQAYEKKAARTGQPSRSLDQDEEINLPRTVLIRRDQRTAMPV